MSLLRRPRRDCGQGVNRTDVCRHCRVNCESRGAASPRNYQAGRAAGFLSGFHKEVRRSLKISARWDCAGQLFFGQLPPSGNLPRFGALR
jgi:hypothetical protein